ncbi:hypothetical protein GN244_ATG13468 [Phytophthora infestans]|uniref:RxLR effector protein n=1 Tax=Phytophthora infestans TaxID=4787 RepID=A0A833SHG1_PHYIN|nr:hypothetical protein GN244_ATG13468 [Phytophthora infestans]KAF4146998.1 hypothetical protein GN958_ATG03809 [Phytophthora infestans]
MTDDANQVNVTPDIPSERFLRTHHHTDEESADSEERVLTPEQLRKLEKLANKLGFDSNSAMTVAGYVNKIPEKKYKKYEKKTQPV